MEPSGNERVDADTLERASSVLDRKWSVSVVRELLVEGPQGFSALEASLDGVSGKVLSDCLDALQESGVVERRVLQEEPLRVEYALTDRGRDLEPQVEAIAQWARQHVHDDRPTVLLVDDDSRLVEMHTEWLADSYEVQTATDGRAARDHLDADIDVLVTDRRMPELTGLELAEYVAASDLSCGVVVLTSGDADSTPAVDASLRKPTTPDTLTDTVERVLADGDTRQATPDRH